VDRNINYVRPITQIIISIVCVVSKASDEKKVQLTIGNEDASLTRKA